LKRRSNLEKIKEFKELNNEAALDDGITIQKE
jgi:hypothetical protein